MISKETIYKEIKFPSRKPSYYRKKNNERYAERREQYKELAREYYRSQEGYKGTLYKNICQRVRRNPSRELTFTKKEFLKFIEELGNGNVYFQLWSGWQANGYKKKYAPSVDRKDNSKGYSLDNIQLITHGDNSFKGHHIDHAHKI